MALDFTVVGKAGQKVQRKMLATYVNVNPEATGVDDYEWELQGLGIEESAIEYNPEVNTVHDITGVVDTSVENTAPVQSFDPNAIRCGKKLAAILADIERRNAYAEYSGFAVMVVHGYLQNNENALPAEIHSGCTIEVTSVGGSSYVEMPFNIHFSNNKTLGTVAAIVADPTFVAKA